MKREVRLFIEKLKAERAALAQKASYMKEHGFEKEEDHIMTKVDVISETVSQLSLLTEGKIGIEDIEFNF